MSRPIVHILIGPSGSGKSTWAKRFCEMSPQHMLIVSADDYHTTMVGDQWVYKFDPAKAPMAHSRCMNLFLNAIVNPIFDHVIVDNTNISLWERQNYIQAAINAGCRVEFEIWKVETVAEIKLCASRNVHGVPQGVIADMALRMDFDPTKIQCQSKSYRFHKIQAEVAE